MSRCNLQRVSVASSSRNTDNWSTLSVLCAKSILASLVQAAVDGSEQDQRHDEVRHQRNDPRRLIEDLFQPQRQENSCKEVEDSRPRAKFNC